MVNQARIILTIMEGMFVIIVLACILHAQHADRINKSISAICREYNIDSSDFVEESSVSDGSNQW